MTADEAAVAAAAGGRPPLCLVLEPSRELAEQTYSNFNLFLRYLNDPTLSAALLVGGGDAKAQVRHAVDG